MKNLNFVNWLLMSFALLGFTMCDEAPKTPDELLTEKLQGAWFCESYYKYITFMESNVMYYEHPNDVGSGFTNEYGEFFVEDSVLWLDYKYADSYLVHKYSIHFAENKLLLTDNKTGNEYVYNKVVTQKQLRIGQSLAVEELSSAKIFDFDAYQSVVLCDKDATSITGFSEGVGFLKLLTNQGEMILRLQVEQNEQFALPDFTLLLEQDKTHIRSLLGIPYLATPDTDGNYILDYFYNSPLMENITFIMDETGDVVRFLVVKLVDGINEIDIVSHLKSKYVFLGDDGVDLMCYIPDLNATEFMAMKFLIVYSREDNTVFFMNDSEME